MHHRTSSRRRVLWTMCACLLLLLLLLRLATAAEARRPTGLHTGGSQHDVVTQNRESFVSGWLSVLHESTVQVWTREHRWFLRPCSRVAFPTTLTQAHRHGLDDGDGEPSDTNPPAPFAALTPLLWPWTRAPDVVASHARAPQTAPACRSFTPVDPFVPRPPPPHSVL
jgi:hypothetical protein